MQRSDDEKIAVKATAALIDPGSMAVLWTNGQGSGALLDRGGDAVPAPALDEVVPMAEALGVPEVLRSVAETGLAQHVRADVVSTAKGAMALVASVYRLPDGKLLVLTEHTWVAENAAPGGNRPRRPGRRAR